MNRLSDLLESLEYEDRLFRLFWREGPVPMAFVSGELHDFGRYVEVNERFCNMLRMDKERLLTSSILDVCHESDGERVMNYLLAARLGRKVKSSGTEKKYVRSDGAVIPTIVYASSVFGTDDSFRYMLKVVLPCNPNENQCAYLPPGARCKWREVNGG